MTLAVIATIVMSFFIALLLGCVDLHPFEVCAAPGCTTQIGRQLRRTIKLAFRKLNSISSDQIWRATRSPWLSSPAHRIMHPVDRTQLRPRAGDSPDHGT